MIHLLLCTSHYQLLLCTSHCQLLLCTNHCQLLLLPLVQHWIWSLICMSTEYDDIMLLDVITVTLYDLGLVCCGCSLVWCYLILCSHIRQLVVSWSPLKMMWSVCSALVIYWFYFPHEYSIPFRIVWTARPNIWRHYRTAQHAQLWVWGRIWLVLRFIYILYLCASPSIWSLLIISCYFKMQLQFRCGWCWCAFTSTACTYLAKTFHKLSICCKVSKQQHKTVCSQLSCFLYLSVVKVFLIGK